MNFAQYMAARGIKGSAGGMPEIYRNAGLQGSLGALNRQEAQANTDIENQRYALKSNYNTNQATLANNLASDIEAAKAGSRSDLLNQQIQLLREYAAKQEAEQEKNRQAWISNIGQYSDNYQAQIDIVANDGDPSNDWQLDYLRAARAQKVAQNEENQRVMEERAAAATTAAEQQAFENAITMWQEQGTANEYVASILGVPVGTRTANHNLDRINAAIAQQNANTSAKNAETAAAQAAAEAKKYAVAETEYDTLDSVLAGMNNNGASGQALYNYIIQNAADNVTAIALIDKYGLAAYVK
jgi:hypothetical protein